MFSANASQVSNDVKYIEDFCSVYLRTGTGSSQTVTTGVKENTGALVISKSRSAAAAWAWYDTFRGATKELASNTTAAEITQSQGLTSFNTDGHTWGTLAKVNTSGATYVDFVLKPTPKFFDVVTYTGNGSGSDQVISHNLGSTPGCVIVKATNASQDWVVWHRGVASPDTTKLFLNLTNAALTGVGNGVQNVTATTFVAAGTTTVNNPNYDINVSGRQYVAYLFAHNAGGFGLTGTDNVISCGSYTGNGSTTGPVINLGYEPQWLLVKNASAAWGWVLVDNMRGLPVGGTSRVLNPNTSDAEGGLNSFNVSATGFSPNSAGVFTNTSGETYIYIAIRRGPMKTPTSGTSVFEPVTRTNANAVVGTLQAADMGWFKDRTTTANWFVADRLRGIMSYYNPTLYTNVTDAEATPTTGDTVTAQSATTSGNGNIYFGGAGTAGDQPLGYSFKRAPGFFDVVCYKGTASATLTVPHNLRVTPELMIFRRRNDLGNWAVYVSSLGVGGALVLNQTNANNTAAAAAQWNAPPDQNNIYLKNAGTVGANTFDYVAYLFASCPGVSKVFNYTGNGSSQTINCGFTGGARFVMIKRTDSTGDWYVWDTARGIVANNDPHLSLNSTAAEVTTNDTIDTDSTGFVVNQVAATNVNVSSATYIGLAIA